MQVRGWEGSAIRISELRIISRDSRRKYPCVAWYSRRLCLSIAKRVVAAWKKVRITVHAWCKPENKKQFPKQRKINRRQRNSRASISNNFCRASVTCDVLHPRVKTQRKPHVNGISKIAILGAAPLIGNYCLFRLVISVPHRRWDAWIYRSRLAWSNHLVSLSKKTITMTSQSY